MIRASITCLVVVVLATSCTSFAFPNRARGSAPSELKDRDRMVRVPSGSFSMGYNRGEPDEFPPHEVDVGEFVIDKTEVTIADYARCMDASSCRVIEEVKEARGERGDHPVTGVTWNDAVRYCRWVGKRLPTEAEWEKAARAPKWMPYPWEGRFDPKLANSSMTGDGYERTSPVGAFPGGASGLGVQDMAGNAAEWTADFYESTWYQKSGRSNPKGPEADTGERVVRGGAYTDNDYLCRSTARTGKDPNVANVAIGFRCAANPGG
jgi:formylglycine-generating enzyme required for sulfatase activity